MRPDSVISWQAYPALVLASCLAGGVATAGASGLDFWVWIGMAGVASSVAAAGAFYGRRRLISPRPLLGTLAAGFILFALGGARSSFDADLPANHIGRHADRTSEEVVVRLEGRVADDPVLTSGRVRFALDVRRLVRPGDTSDVRGLVHVTLGQSQWKPEQVYPVLERGNVLHLRGRLRPPPLLRNPADFDYGGYLQRRGVYALLSIYEAADVTVLGTDRGLLDRVVVPVRRYATRCLDALLPTERGRMVLSALLLGDRSRIDEGTREAFVRTGLMHLLAVSGLHVLLVGMVLYALLRPMVLRLGVSRQTMELFRAAATMAVLGLYLFLTGGSASTVRAVIMAGLLIGGVLLQRPTNTLNALGVAALVLLLLRPAALFDVGFQLSFAAVGAIVTLGRRLDEAIPSRWQAYKALKWLVSMISVSLAATLGTMPVLLYHFGFVSFAGLVLNIAAIPLTMGTLSAGLAMLLLGWMPPLAAVFGVAADTLARVLLWTASWGEQGVGWAALNGYLDNTWMLLAMLAGLVAFVQWPRPRLRWRWIAAALFLTTSGVWTDVARVNQQPRLDVLFFDVGQGDAALVSLPNGRHLLIDAGLRDGFTDQGVRTLLPHFERYGIRELDAVVISHPHSDHLGGLPALLRALPIHRVMHNGDNYSSELYAETAHLLDSLQVPHQAVRAGDTLALDPDVRIHVLAPEPDRLPENTNDASVVLRAVYGETAFLFTGDAEKAAEEGLSARYGPLLESTVIKVGHHGSSTSSTPAFISYASPDSGGIAIVSVARRNKYGLPDEEALRRWHQRGADVRLTAEQGALWLRSDGQHVREVDWR